VRGGGGLVIALNRTVLLGRRHEMIGHGNDNLKRRRTREAFRREDEKMNGRGWICGMRGRQNGIGLIYVDGWMDGRA
jgi:hypothetical protein